MGRWEKEGGGGVEKSSGKVIFESPGGFAIPTYVNTSQWVHVPLCLCVYKIPKYKT